MATNPLFPRFTQRLSNAVGKWLKGTALGKFLDSQQAARNTPNASPAPAKLVQAAAKQMRQLATQVAGQTGAAPNAVRRAVLSELERRGGPLGELVTAILRPGGKAIGTPQQEAQAAAKLMQQLGQPAADVPPPPLPRPATPTPQPEDMGIAYGDGPELRVLGRRYRFPPDDPILTGQMIPVQSSNVHSIGFIWNPNAPEKGTLKVRFLGTHEGGRRSGGGPWYFYYNVHPAVFQAFRVASSKGKFVWDRLRIRGTVSGHQYRYQLAGLQSNGYVPRQATRIGDEEWYLRRIVKGQNGQTYESRLRNEMVRRLGVNRRSPDSGGFRGRPNRGGPDRGTPDRGR